MIMGLHLVEKIFSLGLGLLHIKRGEKKEDEDTLSW